MGEYWVLGGRQKTLSPRPEWSIGGAGVVVKVDSELAHAAQALEYVSPPEVCPEEEPSILFKAGTVLGDRMYVCTQTEVLVYRLPSFDRLAYLSLPCFNDVHHVRPMADGSLVVVCSGLDLVVRVDLEGKVLDEWWVLGQKPWSRFSRSVDYRKVLTTKPHYSHPNFAFLIGNELWTTRFEQRDAVSLSRPGRRIAIDIERPHDGILVDDRLYFTTVDGHVVLVNAESLETERVIDLTALAPPGEVLGWCRGILPIDRRHAIIGFSRMRRTRLLDNVAWVRRQLGLRKDMPSKPTHIACIDLEGPGIVWEVSLESVDVNCIFSIHAA